MDRVKSMDTHAVVVRDSWKNDNLSTFPDLESAQEWADFLREKEYAPNPGKVQIISLAPVA